MELTLVYAAIGIVALIGIVYNHFALKRERHEAGLRE